MAYILGFLYADGNIVKSKRGNHFVALYTADRPILVAVRACWRSNHKITTRQSATGSVHRIQIGSKEWFKDLGKVGLFPNKTRRLEMPEVPGPFVGDFVRGYFDGDGNVWTGRINKHRKTPTQILQAVFTGGPPDFLRALRTCLQTMGVVGGGVYIPKKGTYARLSFSTRDALKLYKIMYNSPHKLFLKRKKKVFERFMKMRL